MRQEGNFKLENLTIKVQGTAFEVGPNNITRVRYYEDIRRCSVKLEVTLTDSEDALVSKIFGMEPLLLKMRDHKGNIIELDMIVYEIVDRQIIDGKQMKGTLRCCNPDVTNSAGLLISQQFEDKNVGDIVQDLLTKVLKTQIPIVKIDPSINKITFSSNYWNPIKIIEWLTDKAIYAEKSGKSATAGFVFYETQRGYHFRAMDALVKQEAKYVMKMGIESDEEEKEKGNLIEVSNLTVKKTSNVLKGLNYGSYTSRVTVFDIGNQKVEDFNFNAYELYDQIPKLNQGSLPDSYSKMSEKTPSRIMTKVINSKLFNAGEYTKDLTKILSQASFRNTMFFNKEVEVEYIGDLSLEVGDVVELENYIGRDREKDPVNSGKYIVGQIYREYTTTDSKLATKVTLYNDSLGTGTETNTTNQVSSLLS
jgi:hypothetical protein